MCYYCKLIFLFTCADLDPDKQRPSRRQESTSQGEGHEPPRYARLNVATKTCPDGYTDLNRAKSVEGKF